VSFAYPKLRVAELQRNAWVFAIREAILRAVDTDTMLIAPAMWSSVATNFVGQVVSDETGYLWGSRIPNNLNNQPQNSNTWLPRSPTFARC
jgi:hypothetical protein